MQNWIKSAIILLSLILAIGLALWAAVGPVAMLASLAVAGTVLIISVGVYVGWQAAMSGVRTGAELVIRGQESDDRRDVQQIRAMSDAFKQGAKNLPNGGPQAQLLPPDQNLLGDGSGLDIDKFEIEGFRQEPQ